MIGLFNRKLSSPTDLHNIKEFIEDVRELHKPYNFNLFNSDGLNNNLLFYGNAKGSSSKFFNNLIQQEHKQYPNLTSFVFTTSLEYYQELIDSSNIRTGTYSLLDFKMNPFETFVEYVKNNEVPRYQIDSQAIHQVESLIKDVIKDSGMEKVWTQEHSLILSYKIQELVRNADKTPTMLELYTNMYKQFLEKGNCLTETFETIKGIDALDSEIIDALDPFTEEKNKVLLHFKTLKGYQIYQDILIILSKFIRFDRYSEYFSSETKIHMMNDNNVVFIEVPKNYKKSDLAALTFLTEYLIQSKESDKSLRAIYHDIQCADQSNLLIPLLRKCRRYGVGIRVNLINKPSRELMSNFSKYAVVQSKNLQEHHLHDHLFNLSEEVCDYILSLQDGESYVLNDNYLLDEKWNGKKLTDEAAE
ncbi:hypothetical protein [Lysinibacillus sphaericus]|uniref:hypothetical protein n=1 Tax=Lysinibacillus sphaericus TaxID=1421 RepID=UPI000C18B10E|nr:hypothetical protein [Lysinibacillus sphaericus]PIJ98199.1 hypothetical protein CTN02_10685 [Lysinibacillus sphaericus]